MWETIPGTALPYTPGDEKEAFHKLAVICSSTNGLTLSQLRDMTGLESTTIQNWVKRGWVANPLGKRYGEVQVARVLLINMLRGGMQLEHIAALMQYVNGKVEDRRDDIIPDQELFNRLCRLLYWAEEQEISREEELRAGIARELLGYQGPATDAKEKLSAALYIMVLAHQATERRKRVVEEWNKTMKREEKKA